MPFDAQDLLDFLTSPQLRTWRAPRVAALDANPHEVCVYYIAHLHNVAKIASSGGILPKVSVGDVEGDLAGQQVQWRRENVELTLGHASTNTDEPLRRPLHSCVNFFWNPDNLTKWAFQVRALHQAAELDDPGFGCLCIMEIPLSTFVDASAFYWCASDVNLASRAPRHTHSLDDLMGSATSWPWRAIYANRDRLHNAAELVVFRTGNGNQKVSAPIPTETVSRVLVSPQYVAAAKHALKGTDLEPRIYELHNSAIFPSATTCLRQESLFSSELAALSRFGLSPLWLREMIAAFRTCSSLLGCNVDPACFEQKYLAYSQHGIGHVTRVLFWAMLLSKWQGLAERDQRCVLMAALAHDLARRDQRVDAEHGSRAASSDFLSSLFAELCVLPEDQNVVREAVRLHSVDVPGAPEDESLVSQVLRNADALERGRFGKPWTATGCDPRRLDLPVFQENPGAAEALASIAQRIALFTRYENWMGDTYVQLAQRIDSALRACVHHNTLSGSVADVATSLLDAAVVEPEPLPLLEIQLSGGMIPEYAYTEPSPPAQSAAWQQYGTELGSYTFATTVSCEWEDSPLASVLENIVTRGTPCPASRYVTDAAHSISSAAGGGPEADSSADLRFTARIHQIQRAVTHLMAGQALPVDAPLWRLAVSGVQARTAYVAVVDFCRLLRAIRTLQNPGCDAPQIELLLPDDASIGDLHDEPGLTTHSTPTGRYEASIEIRGEPNTVACNWNRSLRYIHRVVVSDPTDSTSTSKSPLRSSDPVEYTVDPANPKHTQALEYLLRNIFWKEEFRPGQLEVIARALQREDVIALLPTGAGKSLTYQLASLLQPGLTIVVDPLKSLMRDQDKSLKAYGIDRSVFINSSLNSSQISAAMDEVARGCHQFVFVSPERLQIKKFRHMLRSMEGQTFAFCVVDEAHCVSEWGHDFRTSYLRLGDTARRYCPSPDGHLPLVALTGTASYDVLSDVQKELDIQDAEALVRPHTYEREELQFAIVQTKPPAAGPAWKLWQRCAKAKQDALASVLDVIPSQVSVNGYTTFEELMDPDATVPSAGLIFCPHKTGPFGAQTLTGFLEAAYPQLAHAIGAYHGASDSGNGPDDDELEQIQVDFMSGRKSLLACTKAFGMGIDKPNIRFTVHFAMPQSIEAFYQEAGRAGRDRETAYCGLIYTDTDTGQAGPMDQSLLMSFHANSFPGRTRDASGLAELLLGSDDFRTHGDTWTGLEDTFRAMNPRESRTVSIPFDNYGTTAVARAVQGSLNRHVSTRQVRDALFFCGSAEKFINKLARSVLGRGAHFSQALSGTLASLYNSTRLEPETFRAVYRLLVLGLLEDYELDYGRKRIHATLVRLDDSAIKTNLITYLTRYLGRHDRRVQPATIDARRGATVLQKCCGHLLDFVYSEIAAKRQSAMDNMESAVRGGLEYGIDEFARRVNTYFDSRFTSNILDDLREKPVEEIIETYIKESKGRPDDVEHLWGSCDRLLETNPTHAGLYLLRAFAHWVAGRSLDDARRDVRRGYEILVKDNAWTSTQLAAFQTRYIAWVASVNPDAADLARAEIAGQHVTVLSHYVAQALGGN